MHRTTFLKTLALLPFASAMNLHDIHKTATSFAKTERMPVLFVGHGSPMNALEDNAFTRRMKQLGREIRQRQVPNAILVVSAHWLTRGTFAGLNEQPETIHDFGGFPQELFAMQYPAPGAPAFAQSIIEHVQDVHGSHDWGLDHGTWTILHHLFPEATIPVFQLSLDATKSMQQHFDLARQLRFLRDRGVLIIGSGNIVHNLRQSMPKLMMGDATPYDWATEFDEWVKAKIDQRDFASLVNYQKLAGGSGQLSVPTTDHYLPVLYSLGLADPDENIAHTFEEVSYGGLSMRTFMAG
ncbi:4,5-DOPA-extradiol-dioxygenase [Hymenobacter cellulosilyticus]|uniref:4,5-DOPA dioxygenase extradiol n=1 Tax=Hymenobacter cellulosilyticus TaxID=2932248 RepID=A0A8T9Q1R8_9BACT|nr:4,5-DOPA dioxygenase extradiol [Hymenobacter cellulosilyticus]UOQ71357.1 4,5-DOPA dioxygenase extradiol [Hymenobacter cellulosilyticus]